MSFFLSSSFFLPSSCKYYSYELQRAAKSIYLTVSNLRLRIAVKWSGQNTKGLDFSQKAKLAQAVLLLVIIFPLVIVLHGENIS